MAITLPELLNTYSDFFISPDIQSNTIFFLEVNLYKTLKISIKLF